MKKIWLFLFFALLGIILLQLRMRQEQGYVSLTGYLGKAVSTFNIFDPGKGTVSVWLKFKSNSPARRDHAIFHTDDSRYVLFVDTYQGPNRDIVRIGARAGGNRKSQDPLLKAISYPEASIIIDNDGSLKGYAAGQRYCSVVPFLEDEWHLVTMTWEGYPTGSVRIYLDGQLLGEKAYNSDYDDGTPPAKSLSIGMRPSGWRGEIIRVGDKVISEAKPVTDMSLSSGRIYIKDLRLYQRAISDKDIKEIVHICAGGKCRDAGSVFFPSRSVKVVHVPKTTASSYDKPAIGISRMIFLFGIVIMVVMCIGLFTLAYKLIPKTEKIRACSVEEFIHANQIAIYLPRSNDIILKPGSKYFTELINNFTGDKKAASEDDMYSDKLFLKIKNRRYTIEVSLDGWNFKGELRNCRVLRNPLQVNQIIDSLKEEYLKKREK